MPVRMPEARRADSTMAQTEPLPLVPATWMVEKARWGRARAARRVWMRSRPSLIDLNSLPRA